MSRHFQLLLIVGCAGLALVAGCTPGKPNDIEMEAVATELRYTRDGRTGLCFAALSFTTHAGHRGTSIANVPCDSIPEFRPPRPAKTLRFDSTNSHAIGR